jgi:hypothetical protein
MTPQGDGKILKSARRIKPGRGRDGLKIEIGVEIERFCFDARAPGGIRGRAHGGADQFQMRFGCEK